MTPRPASPALDAAARNTPALVLVLAALAASFWGLGDLAEGFLAGAAVGCVVGYIFAREP